ncbi:Ig-like domain-containing protein [Marivita sp. GX14005]|uniref:Ig-like domain-containing protein n=1 Tax=Marivita sp. GX14005 TaxID=2942276 RepID=UPI002018B335|nr:Ig-like domain-containing protein [Marivita sp. GX14005]MCL3882217.1 Ig-like domain-containing protein [Marivita sp. GX14005]
MNAIDFVARTPAGATERGVVGESGQALLIDAGGGRQVSLNLHRNDLRGYDRAGNDLQITLADGRVIVLEDYFGAEGSGRLFLSTDGVLHEVSFAQGDGGALFAQYGEVASWGKWSPDDALIFFDRPEVVAADMVAAEEEGGVSMLAAGLLAGGGLLPVLGAGAAVATGAAVMGGNGDGDDDGGKLVDSGGEAGGPITPTVNDGEVKIGGDDLTDEDRTVLVSGTANPGDTITVVIGDKTQTTTTGDDGTWEVIFTGPDFPADGSYTADVTVTGEVDTTLTGPTVIIDTTPPPVAITSGTMASGEIITDSEFDGGATVTGTTEPGASVALVAGGVSHGADVDAQGNWSVTLTSSTFERGEYVADIKVVATDSFNNSTTITDGIQIDTVSGVTIDAAMIETDGVINDEERADGVQITGTTDPGSDVSVEMNGYTRAANVDAQGNWSVTFAATEIPVGEQMLTINATATDAVGNVSEAAGDVRLDTWVRNFDITSEAGGADGVVNGEEAEQGLSVTGTTEPGANVTISLGGVSRPGTVDAQGNWSVTFLPGELPGGEQSAILTASSTDPAGNTVTETRNVVFDTDAGLLTISPEPVEGDDIVNQVEASDGVTLTGTSTPHQMVDVALDGVTKTVQTDAFGLWSASYGAGEVRPGEHEAQITAYTVDAAGNELTRTDSVMVDTIVRNFAVSSAPVTTDNVVNGAEHAAGVTLSGTTEPGGSVTVAVEGITRIATVDAQGNWSVSFSPVDLPTGTYSTTAQISTEDAAGNTATTTKMFRVDTEVAPLTSTTTPGGADGVVNAAEAKQGFTLTGDVEPGSSVTVTIDGQTMTAQVAVSGAWSVAVPASMIPAADGDTVSIGISATDRAGNTESITQEMVVDTIAPDAPDMTSITRDDSEQVRGLTLETTEHDVAISRVTGSGGHQPVEVTEYVQGDETQYSFNQNVPDGSHLVVTQTDAAGNTSGTYIFVDDPASTQNGVTVIGNQGANEIKSIDLEFADNASLTLTEAQVLALSGDTNEVQVHGNANDSVTLAGATKSGARTENGTTFNVYDLGDATVLIDEDIGNVTI